MMINSLNIIVPLKNEEKIIENLIEKLNPILNKIDSIGLRWGTDGEAVGQMAEGYFTDATIGDPDNPTVRDDKSPCQLNYVIVIGDGNWTNHNAFKTHMQFQNK